MMRGGGTWIGAFHIGIISYSRLGTDELLIRWVDKPAARPSKTRYFFCSVCVCMILLYCTLTWEVSGKLDVLWCCCC